MNSSKIFALIPLLFFMTITPAQKKQVNSIQWKEVGELPAMVGQQKSLGFAGPVSGVHHDLLIVAGGANFPGAMPWMGGRKKYYDDIYVFKKDNKGSLKFYKSFRLPEPIAYAACCSTPMGVIYAGGENETGISNKVLLMQWDATAKKIIFKNLPNLPVPVTNASITSSGNILYLAGGETSGAVSDLFLAFDMNNFEQGWKKLPAIPHPVSHAVVAVQSNGDHNCIYLVGGRKKNNGNTSDLYADVYQFDPHTNLWTAKKPLPYNLSAGTGVAMGISNIMLFGGDKGFTFHQTEKLIAAISQEKNETKKEALNQEKIQLQSTHPGFSKEILQYNTITDMWSVSGLIPYNAPVTTNAIKWGDCVIIPSGEIKAGIRTPKVLAGRFHIK